MKRNTVGAKAVYAMFFLSGISGLIYETVWLRMLIRVLGNTVYATSIILAAFMAGLALEVLRGKIFGPNEKTPSKVTPCLKWAWRFRPWPCCRFSRI